MNDASTDDTLQILREYAQDHANLVVLNHLVNRNLGAARNTGLAVARGECIAYVDSDDEVKPGIVDALKRMEEENLDMVAMRVEHMSAAGAIIREKYLPYGSEEVFQGIRLMTEHPFWMTAVWGYLYRRAFLERVAYPFVEGFYQEDGDFVNRHLYHSERMAYVDASCYLFHVTPGSINSSFSVQNAAGFILLGSRYIALYEHIEDKSQPFAQSMLEGGGIYIKNTFRKLMRLKSVEEIKSVYNLIDTRIDRKRLSAYHEPAYCWKGWTRICLRHRYLATMIAGAVVSMPWLQASLRRKAKR